MVSGLFCSKGRDAITAGCIQRGWWNLKVVPDDADCIGFDETDTLVNWVLENARHIPGEGFHDLELEDITEPVGSANHELE